MNKTDNKILNLLKKNARASISNIAAELSLTRTTVRNKISKLINNGEILGFTILTKSDVKSSPVRGLVMVEIEGTGAHIIQRKLIALQQVKAVHTTNGKYGIFFEISNIFFKAALTANVSSNFRKSWPRPSHRPAAPRRLRPDP